MGPPVYQGLASPAFSPDNVTHIRPHFVPQDGTPMMIPAFPVCLPGFFITKFIIDPTTTFCPTH